MVIQLLIAQHTFPVPIGFCIRWIHGVEEINTVAMQCPTCLKAFCLAEHTISDNGVVSPSVVCPFNCGFHEMITIR